MIVAAIAVVATGWIALVLALCRAMAPKTDEERRFDDDAQMAALAKLARGRTGASTPATGYIEPDPCPVGGVERVVERAMPS